MKLLSERLMDMLLSLQRKELKFAYASADISMIGSCRDTCSGSCENSCAGECENTCAGDCVNSCAGDCEYSCAGECENGDF